MKKDKKTIIITIIGSIILFINFFIFVACCKVLNGETYKEDINKNYKNFWNYSLGKYSYDYVTRSMSCPGGLGCANERLYTFTFTNYKGVKTSIEISNYYNDDLEVELKRVTEKILNKEFYVIEEEASKKFEEISPYGHNLTSRLYISKIDNNIKYYDSNKGIAFKNLSLENIEDNNIKVELDISIILNCPIDSYENLKTDLLNAFSILFEKINKNIIIKFDIDGINNGDRKDYILTYNNDYVWS